MRHPQWQIDTPKEDMVIEGSFGDSLKDVHESSLRLSVDGDKRTFSLERNPAELEKVVAQKGEPELQDQVKQILNTIKQQAPETQSPDSSNKPPGNLTSSAKFPPLRRQRRLFVIALDCYDEKGGPNKKMLQVIHEILKAVGSDSQMSLISGFALSTALPVSETLELLKSGKIQPKDFDALICSSGSEIYYPGTYLCTEENGKFCHDPDYADTLIIAGVTRV